MLLEILYEVSNYIDYYTFLSLISTNKEIRFKLFDKHKNRFTLSGEIFSNAKYLIVPIKIAISLRTYFIRGISDITFETFQTRRILVLNRDFFRNVSGPVIIPENVIELITFIAIANYPKNLKHLQLFTRSNNTNINLDGKEGIVKTAISNLPEQLSSFKMLSLKNSLKIILVQNLTHLELGSGNLQDFNILNSLKQLKMLQINKSETFEYQEIVLNLELKSLMLEEEKLKIAILPKTLIYLRIYDYDYNYAELSYLEQLHLLNPTLPETIRYPTTLERLVLPKLIATDLPAENFPKNLKVLEIKNNFPNGNWDNLTKLFITGSTTQKIVLPPKLQEFSFINRKNYDHEIIFPDTLESLALYHYRSKITLPSKIMRLGLHNCLVTNLTLPKGLIRFSLSNYNGNEIILPVSLKILDFSRVIFSITTPLLLPKNLQKVILHSCIGFAIILPDTLTFFEITKTPTISITNNFKLKYRLDSLTIPYTLLP